MTPTVRSAAGSDIGRRRAANQDSAYTSSRLLAVADGMGGHAHGEVASAVAINAVAEVDASLDGVDLQNVDLLSTLGTAMDTAAQRLTDVADSDPALRGTGTTLVALLLGTLWVLNVLARSPFGRIVRALREDDVVAATLGKNVLWARVRVFAIGGAFIGLAGSLHAFYYQYIDPTQFSNIVIAYAFMAVIAGGRGAHAGAIWGAAAVMVLLEGSRFLKDVIPWLDSDQLAAIRIIIIGVGLILLLVFRPQGFLREHRLQVDLATARMQRP